MSNGATTKEHTGASATAGADGSPSDDDDYDDDNFVATEQYVIITGDQILRSIGIAKVTKDEAMDALFAHIACYTCLALFAAWAFQSDWMPLLKQWQSVKGVFD